MKKGPPYCFGPASRKWESNRGEGSRSAPNKIPLVSKKNRSSVNMGAEEGGKGYKNDGDFLKKRDQMRKNSGEKNLCREN